jgi:hypothetical protein
LRRSFVVSVVLMRESSELVAHGNRRFGFFAQQSGLRIVRVPDPKTGIDHYKCAQCDPETRKKVP